MFSSFALSGGPIAAEATPMLHGAFHWTEASDSWVIHGALSIAGALRWTEAADTWALPGQVTVAATLRWNEAADTWVIQGNTSADATRVGVLAWQEASDIWHLRGRTTPLVADPKLKAKGGTWHGRPNVTRGNFTAH